MKKRIAKATTEQKREALRFYLLGLTLPEISKLLDGVSVRTLEKWQAADQWTSQTKPDNIKKKCFELKDGGKSVSEIALLLNLSKSTVYRHLTI
jgi:transposase